MILVDTNVAARVLQPAHPHFSAAVDAMARLATDQGEEFGISVHSLCELYFVMTEPAGPGNGFGYTPEQASKELTAVQNLYVVLAESPASYPLWLTLIQKYQIKNRQCFDAKIVASMIDNRVPTLLTFNDQDFKEYSEIQTLNPFDVLGRPRL